MFKSSEQKNNSRGNRTNRSRGFTIIESLVAILILLISITGPLYFTQGALRVSFVSRDQVTAFFLAQDAIEYVKNVRDKNAIDYLVNGNSSADWLDGLSNCVGGNECRIDTNNGSINIISSPEDAILKIDDISGLFNYSGGTNSIYTRSIQIDEIVDDREAVITVTITWDTHETIGTRTIQVKEHIFNWVVSL